METRQSHLLILDGDPQVRSSLNRFFRHHGYRVSASGSPQRVLRRLRQGESFACLITELILPPPGGASFIQMLADEQLLPLAHVLILTVLHNVDNATAYLRFGCGAYCGKPWDNQRLLALVEEISAGGSRPIRLQPIL